MADLSFFDRDLSWLSFNERILTEAAKDSLPLLERVNFLAIYSSNLDEFYRVRMPVLKLSQHIKKVKGYNGFHTQPSTLYREATDSINKQLEQYGNVLTQKIIPGLKQHNIYLLYKENIPPNIKEATREYFLTNLLAFIQPVKLSEDDDFFPENNKLYLCALLSNEDREDEMIIINIPSDNLPRFFTTKSGDTTYVVFIDDILKDNLSFIFPAADIKCVSSFKITRDAELDLQDEYEGDIAEKIEMQLSKRDYGFATRFLYQPGIPFVSLQLLINRFKMHNASVIEGGSYHNLKDFFAFPVKDPKLSYQKWEPRYVPESLSDNLFALIANKDIILHTPYQNYNMVLRFFNEAAIDCNVTEIYTTMYRVAGDSKIANALISAAKNGKKVSVFVELKARFDEANNLKWAKRMKAAGVKIIYSIPTLKVHAKVALVKRKNGLRVQSFGLFSTGNLNESTAKIYTDHILFTGHTAMLRELEMLFIFLSYRRKPSSSNEIKFDHLLVAQFNLQQHFLNLVDREIVNAKEGKPAAITIKLNNLEERTLISKLYEASQAGVKIRLIVRSICCLVPGENGMSENIAISRIVDRYLEHGRVFIFHNNGNTDMWLGSSDWMNRNIYRRIEVCFPIYDTAIKNQITQIINLQLSDAVQGVYIDANLNNVPKPVIGNAVQSQHAIYDLLSSKIKTE